MLGNQLKLYVNSALQIVAYNSAITSAGAVGMRAFKANVDAFNAAAAPPQTASLPFGDNFDAPAHVPDLDRTWTEQVGAFSTQNSNAAPAVPGINLATVNTPSGVPNGSVQATVNVTTVGTAAGLVARYTGPGENSYYLAWLYNNAGTYQAYLFLKQPGGFTQLAEQDLPGFSGTGVLRFDFTGPALKLFVDNVEKASATNFTLTTGLVGIRALGATLDDFDAQ